MEHPLTAALASATGQGALDLPPWSVLSFVLLLLAIALLPLLAGNFWHRNRNKGLVAGGCALPVAGYLLLRGPETAGQSVAVLAHAIQDYVSFIILLTALYIIAGGIMITGDIEGKPGTNTAILGIGALLANLVGTTGASMLLIRPFLRINRQRRHTVHLPIFFIFIVSNVGGLLTPLGDPPLFLGFLHGVDFFWTLGLWPQWLVAVGTLLLVFLIWDTWSYQREIPEDRRRDQVEREPLRLHGWINLLFLGGVPLAVLLKSPGVGGALRSALPQLFPCPDWTQGFWAEAAMLLLAALSLRYTPRGLRQQNGFGWGAIAEVAILFAGIFVTMAPALHLLARHGQGLHDLEPGQYFWLTGALSSFLDNAPTYLVFATLAAGDQEAIGQLSRSGTVLLQAISCGAVFMGANTYIGNGPNFMVKALAEEAGYRTPSFFGYLVWSGCILLPLFALIHWAFFLR